MTEVLDRATLKALSTDTRQEIIKLLSKRPYTASELSKILNKHVTTITEHLNTLEKSGLIRRKDSENKWVYYALSDRGERLFKPKFYTWVVVISISILCLIFGGYQIFSYSYFSAGALKVATESRDLAAPTMATEPQLITTISPILIGAILIVIAIILISLTYIYWRRRRKFTINVASVAL